MLSPIHEFGWGATGSASAFCTGLTVHCALAEPVAPEDEVLIQPPLPEISPRRVNAFGMCM